MRDPKMNSILSANRYLRWQRFVSFLLAALLFVSYLPLPSLSVENDKQGSSQSNQNQHTSGGELIYNYDTLNIILDGKQINSLSLYEHEKIEIHADGLAEDAAYQWQVQHPEKDDVWVNILDGTNQSISVTAALVGNVLRADGTVELRCRAYTDTHAYLSKPITVTLLADQTTESFASYASGNSVMPLADDEPAPEFVTITIEYILYDFKRDASGALVYENGNLVYDDGNQAFTSYMATIHGGTDLNTTVHFPTMVGYDSYFGDDTTPSTSYTINLTGVTADVVYTVKYLPAEVDYVVRYYFQNIYDDLYVEDTSLKITNQGRTGSLPPDSIMNKLVDGFTSLYFQPDAIAADGSTVFAVYYERNYYLMEFDCTGGYGTETLYVRYGSYISVPDPVKMGYVFDYWNIVAIDQNGVVTNKQNTTQGEEDILPTTMPAYNSSYEAIWKTAETTYSVVYWVESQNNSKTYIGSVTYPETSGSKVSGSGDLKANMNVCGFTQHSHGATCGYSCGKTVHSHVSGDCVYSCGKDVHDHTSGCSYCKLGLTACTSHQRSCYNFTNATVSDDYSNNYGSFYGTYNGLRVYRRYISNNSYYYYVRIGNLYYRITQYSGSISHDDLEYTLTCHTHGSDCCVVDTHVHTDCTCTLAEHSHTVTCYACGLVEHTHSDSCKEDELDYMVFDRAETNVTVAGDGSTVVNVYYKWKVFEIRFVFARQSGDTVQIANTTGNGHLFNGWGASQVESVPTVSDRFTAKAEEYDGYTIHYIALRAEYGANIESMWPSNDINPVDEINNKQAKERKFGSWAAENGTGYRQTYGDDHANIVGPYPYMSKEMIKSSNLNTPLTDEDTGEVYYLAQRMSAWWGGDPDIVDWYGPIDSHTYHIFVEAIDGSGDRTFKGKEYDLVESHDFVCAHNGSTRVDPFVYEGLVCVNNTSEHGFNHAYDYQKNSALYVKGSTQRDEEGILLYNCPNTGDEQCAYCNCFYYDRIMNTLSFVNYNTQSTAPGSHILHYDVPLNSYNPGAPDYPVGIEPGGYEFKGWYTTPECYDGTAVDWNQLKMPDGNLTLYAKWSPIIRTVTFYSAFSDIEDDQKDTSDKIYHFMKAENVEHGSTVGSAYFYLPEWPGDMDPATNGGELAELYDFVGWFYMDEENKKRFAPDSMEVTRDLVLFAEWQTSIDTTYTVDYVLKNAASAENTQDGNAYPAGEKIADTIFAHSSVGKTKTFAAKGLGELYPAFSKKFFPTVNTHSMLMEPNGDDNAYTFEYLYDDTVFYKVRYLDYSTRTEIAPSVVKSSEEAIITEKFLPIPNYLPQSYYIRKALAYDGNATEDSVIEENVITFYYIQDTEHGLYSIEYYLESMDSTDPTDPNNYYQYESIIGSDDKGEVVHAPIREYEGFRHRPGMNTVITYKADGSPNEPVIGEGASGEISYTGLTIKVYYQRVKYPYIIEYREYGAAATAPALQVIADGNGTVVEGDEAKFDSVLTHQAPASFTLDGQLYEYYIDKPTTEQLTKSTTIRKSDTGAENKLVFYYKKHEVTVIYTAVCHIPGATDYGIVSLYSERSATATALSGSNAIPGVGFRFVGWYSDEACTVPVDSSWLYTPGTPDVNNENGTKLKPGSLDTTKDIVKYFAKFEPIFSSLTITNTVDVTSNETFLYRVQGTGKTSYIDLVVSITGANSVVLDKLPVGDYTVTQLTGWSWEYKVDQTVRNVTVTDTSQSVPYSNTYQNPDWLHSENRVENIFSGVKP